MDKEFMIERITARLAKLEADYKNAVNNRNRNGEPTTPGNAKEIRTHTKRDMNILKLLLVLLDNCSSKMFIDDADAEAGFDRIVEPVHRKK